MSTYDYDSSFDDVLGEHSIHYDPEFDAENDEFNSNKIMVDELLNNVDLDNYGVKEEFSIDDIMLNDQVAAVALGLAEEISDDTIMSVEDKIELLSLIDCDNPTNKSKKSPRPGSFEAWIRSINNGSKTINDPL
jgi:hypothetical protein